MRHALCMVLVTGMLAAAAGGAVGDGAAGDGAIGDVGAEQDNTAEVLRGRCDALVDDLLTKSLGPREITDQLGWKLHDQAHASLVALGDDAVDGLLAIVTNPDEKGRGRALAISILGEIRSARAVPAIAAFLNSPKETLRWHAIEALGEIGTSEAVQALLDRAATPHLDLMDFGYAMKAISTVVNPDATQELAAATRSSNQEIVAAAQQALAHIPTQEALDALADTLSSPDAAVRLSAAAALAGAALPDVPDRLHTALENERDDNVRVEILASLVALGDRAALEPLGTYASSGETRRIHLKATCALVASGDPATAPVLERLLLSSDESVRRDAAAGLGPIGDDTVLLALRTVATHDKDITVREAAAASIEQIEARTKDTPTDK